MLEPFVYILPSACSLTHLFLQGLKHVVLYLVVFLSFHQQDLSLLVLTPGTWKGLNKWGRPRGVKKVTIGKGCGGLRNATVGTQRSLASHCSSVQKPRTANRHRQESSEGHLLPGTKDSLPAGRPSDSICFSQTPGGHHLLQHPTTPPGKASSDQSPPHTWCY